MLVAAPSLFAVHEPSMRCAEMFPLVNGKPAYCHSKGVTGTLGRLNL